MSSTIFLIIALVTTGIFVIQFVLSIFFGDIDADVDVDADISSVVSFKGLTHFGIGFGWYILNRQINLWDENVPSTSSKATANILYRPPGTEPCVK